MMTDKWIFLPVVVHVLLALAAYIALSAAKVKAIKGGEVNEARRGLYDDAWPESVIKINNNIRNQFEAPVLFYILIVMLWALHATSVLAHVLAWLFVASRVLHALIHTGANVVPLRRKVFTFGCLVLLLLSVLVTAGIFTG